MGTEGDVAYPVRCIRTEQYLYVRNFKPDLWPAGNPETGYPNVDGSPTKTLILEQHKQGNDHYFNLSLAKGRSKSCSISSATLSAWITWRTKQENYRMESLWGELRAKLKKLSGIRGCSAAETPSTSTSK